MMQSQGSAVENDESMVEESNEVIAALNLLDLSLLDDEWVKQIWKDKFSQCSACLPDNYAERFDQMAGVETVEIMDNAQRTIQIWLADGAPDHSWEALKDLDSKALLALLYFYIKNASGEYPSIILGIKAVGLYFNLLLIPGSRVFNIFHTAIYEVCMEVFLIHRELDGPTCEMSVQETRDIQTYLNVLLTFFNTFVGKFSMKNNELMKLTLRTMSELTRAEKSTLIQNAANIRDKTSLLLYTKTAFDVMKNLCDEFHGRPAETIRLVFLQIFPNLSLVGGAVVPGMVRWTAHEQNVVRTNAFWFVKDCTSTLGQPVFPNLKILIQHLIGNMPTRADLRPKFLDNVLALISLLPEALYFETMQWIFREAFSSSSNHRGIALDLLSKLIYLKQDGGEKSNTTESSQVNCEATNTHLSVTVPQNDGDPETSASSARVISFSRPVQYLPIAYRRAMLAIIIDRVRDASPAIGAKALSILSSFFANKSSQTITKMIESVFLDPYSQSYEQPDVQNGFVEYQTFCKVLNNGNFSESTANLLPDGKALVDLLLDRYLVSRRYTTRRAAVHLLLQLCQLNLFWMSQSTLMAIGQHCRDPSKQLRKEMIKLMTDLLLFYPGHSRVLLLWVEEVVPAVDDAEDNVVEEALRTMKAIILDKILPLADPGDTCDQFPWKILHKIASLKMRTFLKIACLKWHRKGDVWTQNRINAIMTHIGSNHDPAVWALLSSLSEYVNITNPVPILDYYLNNVVNDDNTEVANLVSITLHNTWQKLKPPQQDMLQKQLFDDLKNEVVPPKLVPITVDIATAMVVVRTGNELQGKKEVAKWTKETALESEKHIENCLGSNKTTRPDHCDKCPFHMTLLSCLTELHPDQISVNTFDIMFHFLTQAKVRPQSRLCKLKAVAVLTLARMAILDNVIASRFILALPPFLSNNTDVVLLNNVIVSVADIGERFPNLIEPLVPDLSLCLKNHNRFLRELALVVIVDLLKEDYLRARSAIVYNLLSLLNDSSPRTVAIIKSYFEKAVDHHKKKINVDETIIRSMFQYNKYKTHNLYRIEELTEREEEAFKMSGPQNYLRRNTVYRFLLKLGNIMDRLVYAEHLSQVVLNGIADELIRVDTPEGEGLLQDTLLLLLCSELQLEENSKNKDGERDDDGENEDVRPGAPGMIGVELLHGKLFHTIVMLCSKMKKTLAKKRNLISMLYTFLRELLRDYASKSDLAELFREDRQLGDEIAHEIKTKPKNLDELLMVAEGEEQAARTTQPNPRVVEAEIRERLESTSSHKRKSGEHLLGNSQKKAKTSSERSVTDICENVSQVRINVSPTSNSSRCSKRSESAKDPQEPRIRRATRSSSMSNVPESNEEAIQMPPPAAQISRLSRRKPATPSVPPKAQNLFSSTPLLSNAAEFDGMDISPVLEGNEKNNA